MLIVPVFSDMKFITIINDDEIYKFQKNLLTKNYQKKKIQKY